MTTITGATTFEKAARFKKTVALLRALTALKCTDADLLEAVQVTAFRRIVEQSAGVREGSEQTWGVVEAFLRERAAGS